MEFVVPTDMYALAAYASALPQLADSEYHPHSSDTSTTQSPSPAADDVRPAKRKPAMRRDPEARKQQNRAAQRRFRSKKELRMIELEERCANLELLVREQRETNARLQQLLASVRAENGRLRSTSASASPPTTLLPDFAFPEAANPLAFDPVPATDFAVPWPTV